METVPLFELESVSVRIGQRLLIDRLSLSIRPGSVVGVVGPNGSGKSTLIRTLARHQPIENGRILLGGRPLEDYGDRELARSVAYLPQFVPPSDGLRARELIALGRYPWHGALGRFTSADRATVDEAIAATDVGVFADRAVDSLSGGERQRVWLAMALAQQPKIMLLDEPISALDLKNTVRTLDLVKALCGERQMTAVIVLHDINMAARCCDEIVAISQGSLVAQGSPADVIRPDVLKRIYDVALQTAKVDAASVPIAYIGDLAVSREKQPA